MVQKPQAFLLSGSVGEPAKIKTLAAKKTADAVCRITYAGIGFATGKPDEAKPTKEQHELLVEGTAAWLEQHGWVAAGGAFLAILWGLYAADTANKPGIASRVRSWFGAKTRDRH